MEGGDLAEIGNSSFYKGHVGCFRMAFVSSQSDPSQALCQWEGTCPSQELRASFLSTRFNQIQLLALDGYMSACTQTYRNLRGIGFPTGSGQPDFQHESHESCGGKNRRCHMPNCSWFIPLMEGKPIGLCRGQCLTYVIAAAGKIM